MADPGALGCPGANGDPPNASSSSNDVKEGRGESGTRAGAGVAPIKPPYLLKRKCDSGDSLPVPVPCAGATVPVEGPPTKRRRRGQNKHRPRSKVPFSEQLCPSFHIHSDTVCRFGERCRYVHDIAQFMASKLPDIAERCFVFDTYGRCRYGPACRFASAHLTPQHENVVALERFDPSRPSPTINVLSKHLQEELRKRTVQFPLSESYLKGGGARTGAESTCGGPSNTHDQTADTGELAGTGDNLTTGGQPPNGGPPTGERKDTDGTKCSGGVVQSCSPEATAGAGGSHQVTAGDGRQATCEVLSNAVSVNGSCGVRVSAPTAGPLTDCEPVKLRAEEKRKVDFCGKLYLAPLTTVGNLPFRRICKSFGADITCSEMALCANLLQGQQSEWALLKRHESEDVFGVQLCGAHTDSMTRCAELITSNASVDFIDINIGCPIDVVFKRGSGCALMGRRTRFESIVRGMASVLDCPLTVKMRTGIYDKNWNAHLLAPKLREWGASLVTVHGRSREQRYTKMADWDFINTCAQAASPLPLFGNGDILSFEDYNEHMEKTQVAGVMIARGALIKPWIFTEIKEQRHWDISSSERLDILHRYANYGLEHWGSDTQGVETTRRFLLEWLSFLYRYIPVGVLEQLPQRINERPPYYCGRDDLETLLASSNCQDWVRISEMLLGPVPANFQFAPKHKANAYS